MENAKISIGTLETKKVIEIDKEHIVLLANLPDDMKSSSCKSISTCNRFVYTKFQSDSQINRGISFLLTMNQYGFMASMSLPNASPSLQTMMHSNPKLCRNETAHEWNIKITDGKLFANSI